MRLSNYKPLFWVGVAGVATVAAALFLRGPERHAYDARLRLRPDRGWPADLVLVAVDDPTLNEAGRWPWPREQLGAFLEQLKALGPKTVLLDVVLAAPSTPASDAALEASFAKVHPILGAGFSSAAGETKLAGPLQAALAPVAGRGVRISADHLVVPRPAFAAQAAALGHGVYFPNPSDGQVRAHLPLLAIDGAAGSLPSTALVSLLEQRGFAAKDVASDARGLVLPTGVKIPLEGGSFYLDLVPGGDRPPTISARDILAAAHDPAKAASARLALGGKLALVYVDSAYTPDLFSSPVAARTTGGLLIAYAIRTLATGHVPRTLPLFPILLGALVIALLAARPLSSQPAGIILGAGVGAAVVWALIACALVRTSDLFAPVMAPCFFFLAAGGLVTGYAGRVAERERTQMRALLDSVKRAYAKDDEPGTVKREIVDAPTRPGAGLKPLSAPTDPRVASPQPAPTGSRGAELGVGTATRRGSQVPSTKSGAELLVGGAPLEEPVEIGQYEVQRSLGRGGMGAIFLAIDRDLDRPVAIKILESVNKETYVRFRREAMAVARISHPNVVQVYEVGLDSTVPFIVMEYVAGGTLSDLMRDPDVPQPLPWDRATKIVAGVARGLGAAHLKGIVHRDMKPANVLLVSRKTEFPKLADFGIAKLSGADQLTREGLVVGTVGYLSPEQALGKPVDPRSDVYSLAVMYYRMLTGARAFEGTTEEMLRASVTRGIPDPREVNPNIPSPIAELVVRMGSLDREPRPKDGNVTAAALDLLLTQAAPPPAAASSQQRP